MQNIVIIFMLLCMVIIMYIMFDLCIHVFGIYRIIVGTLASMPVLIAYYVVVLGLIRQDMCVNRLLRCSWPHNKI